MSKSARPLLPWGEGGEQSSRDEIRERIKKAISLFGSETKLAAAAGVSQASVNEAKRKGWVGPRMAAARRRDEGEGVRKDARPSADGAIGLDARGEG